MKLAKLFLCVFTLVILTSCASKVKPGDYDAAEIGKVKKVVPGVIISKRPVKFHSASTQATTDDSLGQGGMTAARGFEYVIKLSNGEIVSIAQSEDLKLKTKQHILLIQGENTRIVPDDGSDDY